MCSNSLIGFRKLIVAVTCLVLGLSQMSCSNALSSFANKTSDEALFYEAQIALDKADYTTAINACALMTPTFLTEKKAIFLCASSFAGRCGFKTTSMVSYFNSYVNTPPPEKLFHWMMTQIIGTTAQNVSDCDQAMQLMNSMGAASTRTDDENSFAALLSLYSISVVLNETGDIVDDNVLDGGFDACAIGAADSQVVGLSFWELSKSTAQLATNPYYASLDTAVSGLCALLAGETQDLCAAATPLALNAAELSGARTLLLEGATVGVNQCGGGAPISAGCKCP